MSYAATKSNLRTVILGATVLLLASPVFAHNEGNHTLSLGTGFMHPLSGLDHLLAMIAVGIWAAQARQPARWLLPLVFAAVMALGALAGMTAIHLPGIELGIAGSVAVLGLLVAFSVSVPVWASAIAVSAFALVHGYAHGIELPSGASLGMYGAGFIFATLALHAAGMVIGMPAACTAAAKAARLLGAAIAAAGTYLLISVG